MGSGLAERKFVFFVPVLYTFARYSIKKKTLLQKLIGGFWTQIPFMTLYLTALIFTIFNGTNVLFSLGLMIVAYVLTISVYEIGYIVNDTFSAKREGKFASKYIKAELSSLGVVISIIERLLIFAGLILIVSKNPSVTSEFARMEIGLNMFLLVTFTFYNLLSPKARAVFLAFGLRFMKYISFTWVLYYIGVFSFFDVVAFAVSTSILHSIAYGIRKLAEDNKGYPHSLHEYLTSTATNWGILELVGTLQGIPSNHNVVITAIVLLTLIGIVSLPFSKKKESQS
jgi:hypothetical protein